MPQVKKKKTTKTAKKTTAKTHKKAASRTCCKKGSAATISNRDRAHICFVAVLSIVAGILLCTDAAIMSLA